MSTWYARNLACYECASSDAMQESEHHFKCFSCGKTFLKKDKTISIKGSNSMKIQQECIPIGGYYNIKTRGLTRETCQKYKISVAKYTGSFGCGDKLVYVNDEYVAIFNRYSNGGLESQKIRSFTEKKHMKQFGNTEFKEMFGQNCFQPNPSRFVVITEGEYDAATIYQETGFAAVSITGGSSSACNNIRTNIDWLSKWGYVVLAFDNDQPGSMGINEVLSANLFEPGKLRIATFPLKDANDMLMAGRGADIRKVIWDAHEYRPPDIFDARDCVDLALIKPLKGDNTPWGSLTDSLCGWPMNCIVTIAAADGIGKTEIAEEIVHSLIEQKRKVWLYSCEQDRGEILLRLAGKSLNLPLHIPGCKWDEELIKQKILDKDQYIKVWEPEKALLTDEVIAKMRYCVVAYGIKYFFIDHLKGIESQLSDPVRGIGKFMCELKIFVQTHAVCVILLSHVAKHTQQTKSGQKAESWNRGRVPDKENIHGSSAISAWSNIIIAASRNVESDDIFEACLTKLTILKNRLMGNRGQKHMYLKYLQDSGRLVELPQADYNKYYDEGDK